MPFKLCGVGLSMVPTTAEGGPPPELAELREELRLHMEGGIPALSEKLLDLSDMAPFSLKVLRTLRDNVPRGRVVSYKRLAEMAGSPGAARAVGNAMAGNPFPIFFPCHRVVKSDMSLGGYGPGEDVKIYLLEHEGVGVKNGKAGRNYFL